MASYIKPILLRNESGYSFIARASLLNGRACLNDLIQLQRELELNATMQGDAMGVLQVFRFFDGDIPHHLPLIFSSFGRCHSWRVCHDCLIDELASVGTGYWHWDHQLPASFICSDHFKRLSEVVVPARLSSNSAFFLPQDLKIKESGLLTTIDFDVARSWLSISKAAALTQYPACWMPLIQMTIADRYREFGFRLKPEKCVEEEWRNYLQAIGGLGCFDEKLISWLLSENKTVTKRFRQMLPEVLVMIIHRLYESFDAFYEAYKWQAAICNDRPWIKLGKLKFPGRDFHRQACIDFLASNPDASRTDFWRYENGSCRWLIRNDQRWFNHYLPPEEKKYAFQQLKLFEKTN